MYSISDYGEMIADKIRMDAYVSAVQESVKPDSIVLDIGTGTGVFALLACKFGAKHVYAIEPNNAIQVGRVLAEENDCVNNITFIQDVSTNIELPEKADVIISDMRGSLPLLSHVIPSIVDARERHLAKDGIFIPLKDKMRIALINMPDVYENHNAPWRKSDLGLDMNSVCARTNNSIWTLSEKDKESFTIVNVSKDWLKLDYRKITDPNVSGEVSWEIEEDDIVHGFQLWFDAHLTESISFTTDPNKSELVYGNNFFPFEEPIRLIKGQTISIEVKANLVGDDYIWSWNTRLQSDNKTLAEYKQSTFLGKPLPAEQFKKRALRHQPELNDDGVLLFEILKMMDEGMLLKDIASQVVEKFPTKFPTMQKAMGKVGDISVKYSC